MLVVRRNSEHTSSTNMHLSPSGDECRKSCQFILDNLPDGSSQIAFAKAPTRRQLT